MVDRAFTAFQLVCGAGLMSSAAKHAFSISVQAMDPIEQASFQVAGEVGMMSTGVILTLGILWMKNMVMERSPK